MNYRLRFWVRQANASRLDAWHDPDEGWEKVKEKRANRRLRVMRSRALKYAAAILLVVGTAVYFQLDRPGAVKENYLREEPSRVTLLMANGERITWGGDKQQVQIEELGVSITRDSAGSVMQYRVDSTGEAHAGYNELIVPRSCELPVQLPDGSVAWLNSGTSLRFPVTFAREERAVYLEGEGFFEVARDEKRPFRVISGDKVITVLGTRFNVSAYADDPTWHATLVDGKVSILHDGEETLLEPSQQFLFHKASGKSEVRVVETETYTAWTRGQIYFKLSPLEEIVTKLGRWYDFSITYEEEGLRQVQFRGGINKYRPLEETLQYLERTGKVRFIVRGKHVTVMKAM
jgi:ferric-dicitrate binding protein FerR (iron transport regulator)